MGAPAFMKEFRDLINMPADGGFFGSSLTRQGNCESCLTKFGLLKRRRTCAQCRLAFCSTCLGRTEERTGRCRRCRALSARPPDRQALLGLRVRDLCALLRARNVSLHGVTEKTELVDLLLGQEPPTGRDPLQGQDPPFGQDRPPGQDRNTPPPPSGGLFGVQEIPTVVETPLPPYWQEPEATSSSPSHHESPQHPGPEEDGFEWVTAEDLEFSGAREPPGNGEPGPHSASEEQPAGAGGGACSSGGSPQATVGSEPQQACLCLDQFESEEELSNLSVMQMKLLLTRSFVDYRGCCEKSELQEKVVWLWKQRRKQRMQGDEVVEEELCKICMEGCVDCVILDCGHMCTCTQCGKQLSECPICRQYVVRVVHVFRA
ncbi:E3 ubiquitin-protein ligase RNF34 [Ixodes scapularis]|uniref:E3 ubiquitin-protein ligase RNF34 n=1 Tax=Ixodes scapularis TaxID=6945 RepID=UPI001A9EB144|nr:E3 ubiquitin-protein ligase RNF34 [Ixodes scapularis]XP_029851490.2 E3 ubiquitin-protein ligase RNF34 [Ixodes scapularis]